MRRGTVTLLLAGLTLAMSPQDDLAKIVPGAEKSKKSTRKLAPDKVKAIADAIGCNPEDVTSSIVVYDGWAPVPDRPDAERVIATTLQMKDGPKIGVAVVAEYDQIVAVTVLENKGDKALSDAGFYRQFTGLEWSDSIRQPAADLAKALEKAKKDKEAAALVQYSTSMRRVGALWETFVEQADKPDKAASTTGGEVAKLFEAMTKITGDLAFLSERQRTTLKTDMDKSLKALKAVLPKAGDGTPETRREIGTIENLCSRCHGSLPRRFREARASKGLGNGHFSPDIDLSVPSEGPRDKFLQIATEIRKAVLQLRDSK